MSDERTIAWGHAPGPGERLPTRDECLAGFGEAIAVAQAAAEQLTPRELAEGAWSPTSRLSVDELEDRIRVRRGMPPLRRGGDAAEDRPG